jgi:hypothetical protein
LADLHQCKSVLEEGQATVVDHAEQHLTTFARASQNVATMVVLLYTLPTPSIGGVSEVYQRLKNILSTTTV